jgi:hypothetical protein
VTDGRRLYVRLPPIAECVAAWRANGENVTLAAEELGVGGSALAVALRKAGYRRTMKVNPRHPRVLDRIVELEAQAITERALNRAMRDVVQDLAERVEALERRPLAVAVVREDHRRIADGGPGARHARRARA